MLTYSRVAMLLSRHSGFVTSFAITENLIARRALLFEVQRVTSPRLPRLRGLIALFSTYCRQNRIHTVSNFFVTYMRAHCMRNSNQIMHDYQTRCEEICYTESSSSERRECDLMMYRLRTGRGW